jgi:hypothetical protein
MIGNGQSGFAGNFSTAAGVSVLNQFGQPTKAFR